MDGGERQKHGFAFENWIKETFFDLFVDSYTSKWDAASAKFKTAYAKYTGEFEGLPVSIKSCKNNSSIYFGDVTRQLENEEDFLLIVGFWEKAGAKKKVVSVGAVKVLARDWQDLFVTEEEAQIDDYDEFMDSSSVKRIRSLTEGITMTKRPSYVDARSFAKKLKSEMSTGIPMTINPKIDSKKQRRVQCSLSYSMFKERFAKDFVYQSGGAVFWGEKVPLIS